MEGFFSKVGEKQLFVVLPPTRTFATRKNLYPDVADQILNFKKLTDLHSGQQQPHFLFRSLLSVLQSSPVNVRATLLWHFEEDVKLRDQAWLSLVQEAARLG